jgi:hypothetical protein
MSSNPFIFKQAFVPGGVTGGYPEGATDAYGRMNVTSADGDIAFVSAIYDSGGLGIVYVYQTTDNWASPPTLLTTISEPGLPTGFFGTWLQCSSDGLVLTISAGVGAMIKYVAEPNTPGDWTSGAAITVYDTNSGPPAVCGISGDGNTLVSSNGVSVNPTEVRIFRRPYGNPPIQTIQNPDGVMATFFGSMYLISADGLRLAVSAPLKAPNGSVFIFKAMDSEWSSYSTLEVPNPIGGGGTFGAAMYRTNPDLTKILIASVSGMTVTTYMWITDDDWTTPTLRTAGPFAQVLPDLTTGFAGNASVASMGDDTILLTSTFVDMTFPDMTRGAVCIYKSTDDWMTFFLDQMIDANTDSNLSTAFLPAGLQSLSDDYTDLLLGDYRTPSSYVYQRNPFVPTPPPTPTPDPEPENPFGPDEPPVPANSLNNFILASTDRGLIGEPGTGKDASFTNASRPPTEGNTPNDGRYSVLHIGQNRSMGWISKDRSWDNVSYGFIN